MDVRALVCCPACGGRLSAEWSCTRCATRFDAADGVPNLRLPSEGVTETVRRFYEQAPFPGYPPGETLQSLRARAERNAFVTLLDRATPGDARIVDVGCGTGQMCLYLATADRLVVGADLTRASLALGAAAASRFGLDRVQFVETDLHRPGLERGAFDLVYSSGVVHHTPDPRVSFGKLVELARPGGIVVVGVYNAIARLPTRLRRAVARASNFRVVPFDPILRARASEPERREAWLRDQYRHPEEHRHTIGEVQGWFAEHGVEFLRTYPSAVFDDIPDKLMTPAADNWAPERWLMQIAWMRTLGREGGLFLTIGRKALMVLFIALLAGTGTARADQQAQTAPAVAQSDAIASAVAEARALIDGGRSVEAIDRLKPLDQADPRVRLATGVALYHADRRREAIAALEGVRASLPEGSVERREAEQVLGLCLYLEGRFADAIPWLERTRAVAPDNHELNFTLGQAYIQTRDAAGARAALARAFGVAPDAAAAHVVTAQLMIRLQMEALAEAELTQALARDPRTLRANFLLGQIALFRGQLDAAVERSKGELALNPSDAMAFYQLGDALLRQNRGDEAIDALQRSLWLNPFYSGPYILLGRAYTKKGQLATAEGMLRRAVEYDPNNRAAHYLLAQLLQQQGRVEEAKQEFAIAEKLETRGGE